MMHLFFSSFRFLSLFVFYFFCFLCPSFSSAHDCSDIDLRKPGYPMHDVGIRNQGKLGTCFAHSATSHYEAVLGLTGKKPQGFSPSIMATYIDHKNKLETTDRIYFEKLPALYRGGQFCQTYQILQAQGACNAEDLEKRFEDPKTHHSSGTGEQFIENFLKFYEDHHENYSKDMNHREKVIEQITKQNQLRLNSKIENIRATPEYTRINQEIDKSEAVYAAQQEKCEALKAEAKQNPTRTLIVQPHIKKLESEIELTFTHLEKLNNELSQYRDGLGYARLLSEKINLYREKPTIEPEKKDLLIYQILKAHSEQTYSKDKENSINKKVIITNEAICKLSAMSSFDSEKRFLAMLDKILQEPTPIHYLSKIVAQLCHNRVKLPDNWKNANCETVEDRELFTKILDDEFGKGQFSLPIEIVYYPEVLRSGKAYDSNTDSEQGTHSSLIIGRKKVNNSCYYLIRNSWGTDCDQYHSSGWECDKGDIYVEESALFRNTIQLSRLVKE
jgi:hypothetical protein